MKICHGNFCLSKKEFFRKPPVQRTGRTGPACALLEEHHIIRPDYGSLLTRFLLNGLSALYLHIEFVNLGEKSYRCVTLEQRGSHIYMSLGQSLCLSRAHVCKELHVYHFVYFIYSLPLMLLVANLGITK